MKSPDMTKPAADSTPPDAPAARIAMPGSDKPVSIKRARATMTVLTDEAAGLRDDDSSAAKNRRVEIARQLRQIQNAIDATEDIVEVDLKSNATKQWPFRVGEKEFYPGVHQVRVSVAQTLRYMVDQHAQVEANRIVNMGNAADGGYGKELTI